MEEQVLGLALNYGIAGMILIVFYMLFKNELHDLKRTISELRNTIAELSEIIKVNTEVLRMLMDEIKRRSDSQ